MPQHDGVEDGNSLSTGSSLHSASSSATRVSGRSARNRQRLPCDVRPKKRRGAGIGAYGLVDQHKPRVGVVGEQRLGVNGHQILIRAQVFYFPLHQWIVGILRHMSE